MITTAAWVLRGFAAPFPTKYDFDQDEIERIAELAKLQLDDAKEDLEENTAYQVDAELDDLRLYLDAEMQEKAGEWMESVVETITSASIRLDFSN